MTIDTIIRDVRQHRPEDGEVLHQYIAHLRLLKKYKCSPYAIDETLKFRAYRAAGVLVALGLVHKTRFMGLLYKEEQEWFEVTS